MYTLKLLGHERPLRWSDKLRLINLENFWEVEFSGSAYVFQEEAEIEDFHEISLTGGANNDFIEADVSHWLKAVAAGEALLETWAGEIAT